MKTRKAVYAASLDPITNGHINVIERMAPLYDELVVLVAVDSRKRYTFSQSERVQMAERALSHLANVKVDVCVGQYVVKVADSIGAQVIIRGLRNFKDLEAEQVLAEENRRICPHIETMLVPCLPSLMHVSSSMVKSHIGSDPDWEKQIAFSVPAVVVSKIKEKFILDAAQRHWSALMSALGNPKGSDEIYRDLIARHIEAHRAYHDLSHIVSMLDEFEHIIETAEDPQALQMAIWHHDAIYDPGSKERQKVTDNEVRSAELAKLNMENLKLEASFISRVEKLILATAHFEKVSSHEASADTEIIVDLDLAILGKSKEIFDEYEAGIRREYAWVDEDIFRQKRSEALQMFLDRPSIYSTELFQNKYESAARGNLRQSILQLRNLDA